MQNEQIANRIKRLCKEKDIAVNTLIRECNLSKSLIYDLEKRNTSPSVRTLTKIADYFDCSLDYLTGRCKNQNAHRSQEDRDLQNGQIANRIKLLCKKHNVTAKAMLEEIGLNKNFMYDLSKGKSPTVKNLTKIADYFDCSLDYLTGRCKN